MECATALRKPERHCPKLSEPSNARSLKTSTRSSAVPGTGTTTAPGFDQIG